MHSRSADEALGSAKRQRFDVLVVCTSGNFYPSSAEVFVRVIAVIQGSEWIDLNPAIGVEAIPGICIDDDAGFDLYNVSLNSATGRSHGPKGKLYGPTLYLIGLLNVP